MLVAGRFGKQSRADTVRGAGVMRSSVLAFGPVPIIVALVSCAGLTPA